MKKIIKEIILWVEFFIKNIPGLIGYLIRRYWYYLRFPNYKKLIIEPGCEFIFLRNFNFKKDDIIIGNNSFFTADGGYIEVGANSAFNRNVHINASIGGKIIIGEYVLVGPNVTMRSSGHVFSDLTTPIRYQGHTAKDIIIENNVWVGSNVTILGGVKISTGAIVGAGAVVVNDIPPYAIAVGVPAKVIKYRNQ
jgi:galactoside O-acetyltransferase